MNVVPSYEVFLYVSKCEMMAIRGDDLDCMGAGVECRTARLVSENADKHERRRIGESLTR